MRNTMKVISKFKDYYDFVGKIYGEDDKVLYHRKSLDNSTININEFNTHNFPLGRYSVLKDFYTKMQRGVGSLNHLKIVLVCGYVVLVTEYSYNNYRLMTEEELAEVIDTIRKSYFRRSDDYNFKVVEYVKDTIPILKSIGVPVVEVDRYFKTFYNGPGLQSGNVNYEVYLNKNIPNLGELGISKYFAPEPMFQIIQEFITNTLRTNPDINPPVKISDKDRIVSHGFDLKTSFRKGKK